MHGQALAEDRSLGHEIGDEVVVVGASVEAHVARALAGEVTDEPDERVADRGEGRHQHQEAEGEPGEEHEEVERLPALDEDSAM